MTLSGLIGISCFCAALGGALIVGVLRQFLVNWCPACAGRSSSTGRPCTACGGTGILRVPETVPMAWLHD